MGAVDRTENVLKKIHVLFSKAEPYNGSKKRVVVDKTEMMDLLKQLNDCMYDMMDEHELTVQSRDKAARKQQKQGDDIIFEARKKAEDVYAASVLYSDQALADIQEIMRTAEEQVAAVNENMMAQLKEKRHEVKANQYELKSQLQDFIDTEKYIKLIEDENIRRSKEKETASDLPPQPAAYADVKPEIHINTELIHQAGLTAVEGEAANARSESDMEAALSADLDAEYFDWKDGGDKDEKKGEGKSLFSLFSKKDS